MNYKFDDENLKAVFSMIGEEYGAPVREDEITAAKLYEIDKSVGMRTHLRRLKRLAEQGKLSMRIAKQGTLAFKVIEDEE